MKTTPRRPTALAMNHAIEEGVKISFDGCFNGSSRTYRGYLYEDNIYFMTMPQGELISDNLALNVIPAKSIDYRKVM